MSAKRLTNNSTIVNLEDQTAILEEVLTKGGLPAPVKPKSGSGKDKKKLKSKQTTVGITTPLAAGGGGASEPLATPSRDADVMELQAEPARRETAVNQAVLPDNNVIDGAAASPPLPPAQQIGDANFLTQQLAAQQQWLWQQQMGFPLHYGNFVPNYRFGEVEAPHWEDEAEEEQEVERVRQPVHAISDDDEDEQPEGLAVAMGVNATNSAEKVAESGGGQEGQLSEIIKEQDAQVKDADRVSSPIDPVLANRLEKYLEEATFTSDMEKLSKVYPKVKNVENMRVPKLDAELFQVVDIKLRTGDQGLQSIQKAVLASMSAIAPVLDLIKERGKKDPELDVLGKNLLDSTKLQAFVCNSISTKRRELLKPELSPIYAREMSKQQVGSTEWLYGGNLTDTTKKCETARKIGDKVMKRKLASFPRQGNKRFRPQFPQFSQGPQQYQQGQQFGFPQPYVRAYNPFNMNMPRFPTPHQTPQQFMGYPAMQFGGYQKRFRGPRPQQHQKQGFGKKGNQRQ